MTLLVITVSFAASILIDIKMKSQSGKLDAKTAWIYGCMMLVSFTVFALTSFDIDLPSPIQPIQSVIERWIGI